MGGKQSSVEHNVPSHLSKAELNFVSQLFKSVCKTDHSKGCTYTDFVTFCEQLHPLLAQYLVEFYFGQNTNHVLETAQEFVSLYALLIRGSLEEKTKVMELLLLGTKEDPKKCKAYLALKDHRKFMHLEINYTHNEQVFRRRLENYLRGLICSAIKIEISNEYDEFLSWRQLKSKIRISDIDKYTVVMADRISTPSSSEDITKWIRGWRSTSFLNEMVYNHLFVVSETSGLHKRSLFPMCISKHTRHVGLLDTCSILHLNSHLPYRYRTKWRLLFSSAVHGWNFRHLTDKILLEGASIVTIRDRNNYTFGGFASESWRPEKGFYGNCSSYLFQSEPYLKVYESSGRDEKYQQIIMKGFNKGIGMGSGTMNLHGWWIEPEHQRGNCAISCYTFQDVPILASSQYFEIDRFEVWGVGDESKKAAKYRVKYHTMTKSKHVDSNLYTSGKTILSHTGTKKYTDGYGMAEAEGRWNEHEDEENRKHARRTDEDEYDYDEDEEETDEDSSEPEKK